MRIAILFILISCLAALGASNEKITASFVVTNGTTVGQVLTVNGSTRLWTNVVTQPSSQILTNNTAAGSKTNAYNAIGTSPFAQVTIIDKGVTNFDLVGVSGITMTVICTNWATVTYSTQTVSSMTAVRVPINSETAGVQTKVASGLVAGINLAAQTNQISQASVAAAQLLGTTNDQNVSGIKNFTTGIGGKVTQLIGGSWTNGLLTNAIIRGLISPGQLGTSSQTVIGNGASSSGHDDQIAIGASAAASAGEFATAIGNASVAAGVAATALGPNSHAGLDNSLAVGPSSYASASGATAIGYSSTATNDNATAIGFEAHTTANNQVMLGSAGVSVYINNNTAISGSLNVLGTYSGTNVFSGPVQFIRKANSALANGNNAAVDLSTNLFVEVSGPSAAFTINGIAGGRDGRVAIILNQTGQDMTVAHESGTDPVPANRVISMSGSDRTTTGNGAAILIYSGAASRWILISFDP